MKSTIDLSRHCPGGDHEGEPICSVTNQGYFCLSCIHLLIPQTIKHIRESDWIQFQTMKPHKICRIEERKIGKICTLLIRLKGKIDSVNRLSVDIPLLGSNDEVETAFYRHMNVLSLNDLDVWDISLGKMRGILMQFCLERLKEQYTHKK